MGLEIVAVEGDALNVRSMEVEAAAAVASAEGPLTA